MPPRGVEPHSHPLTEGRKGHGACQARSARVFAGGLSTKGLVGLGVVPAGGAWGWPGSTDLDIRLLAWATVAVPCILGAHRYGCGTGVLCLWLRSHRHTLLGIIERKSPTGARGPSRVSYWESVRDRVSWVAHRLRPWFRRSHHRCARAIPGSRVRGVPWGWCRGVTFQWLWVFDPRAAARRVCVTWISEFF